MKNNVLRFLPFAALLSSVALPAQAAPGPALPIVGGPSAIAAGLFSSTSRDGSHNGGSSQFAGEFRYTVPVPNPLSVPTRTVITLGVQTGAHNGNHSTVIPLTAIQEVSLNGTSPTAAGSVYAGAGPGLYLLNQSGISSALRLGGQAEIGYNITSAVFVDARYQFVDHASGVNVMGGLRF